MVPRTDSSGEPIGERNYREEEVAAILHRAARLERDRESGEGVLNLREIEDIARDSGIDLSLVPQAARELNDDDRWGIGAAVAGPTRCGGRWSASWRARSTPGTSEQFGQEIREVLSASRMGNRWMLPGGVSSIGRSLTLSGFAVPARSR